MVLSVVERREVADLVWQEYNRRFEVASGNWGPQLDPAAEAAAFADAERLRLLAERIRA